MRLARLLHRPIIWIPVSVALLAFVAWRSRLWEAGERLGTVDVTPLVAAVLLNAVVMVLWATRSSGLLAAAGRPVGILPLVPMTAFANTINNVTPGSMGELVRLYLLRVHHTVEYRTGTAVILIERLVSLFYLTSSALLFWLAFALRLPAALVVSALLVVAALPGLFYRLGLRPSALVGAVPLGWLLGRERWGSARAWLGRVDEAIAGLLTDPLQLARVVLTTAGVLATYTAQLWLVGRAVGVTLDPVAAWGVLGLGLTAGIASLLPFGLGSTDLVIFTLLGLAGVPAVEATAMTFGFRVVSTLPLGLAGVASYAILSASLPPEGASGAMRVASNALGESGGEP